VIGVDSDTGKGKHLDIRAETEKQAQIKANEKGLMVESVEQIVGNSRQAEASPPNQSSHTPTPYEPVNYSNQTKPKHVRFFGIPMPFFGEEKRKYADRGVNTIGEIAAAVFVGMLAFSCISPVVFVYFTMFLVAWGLLFAHRY